MGWKTEGQGLAAMSETTWHRRRWNRLLAAKVWRRVVMETLPPRGWLIPDFASDSDALK